ncbi:MAG: InlB B-repeat-containing protein [Candidatus Bathyarchaeota archaeon]|nr:InlB B-repeat-containing protein [Candidatus Termiticorpusculum sp.]
MNTIFRYVFNLGHSRGKRSLMPFLSVTFVILLSLSLVVPVLNGVSFFANATTSFDVPEPDILVSTEEELVTAIGALNDGEELVIWILSDIQLTKPLIIPAGIHIVLVSGDDGGMFKLIGANTFDTIIVASNGVLSLYDVIVTHNVGEIGRGVTIESGGEFIMYAGKIFGNTLDVPSGTAQTNIGGGGVCNFGVFTMFCGEIFDNAVTISNSYVNNGGGGGVYNVGTFVLDGGQIFGNTVTRPGGYTSCYGGGGGVFNYMGTFTMTGGEIYSNAVIRTNNTQDIHGGGGVFNYNSYFTMTGGVISQNEAYWGGGVYHFDSNNGIDTPYQYEFIMSGTAVISENTAIYGGGIDNSGIVILESGAKITNNVAITEVVVIGGNSYKNPGYGGGIYSSGLLTMEDGAEISGNYAPAAGGGVYVWANAIGTYRASAFTMNGGKIFDNGKPASLGDAVTTWGGGVAVVTSNVNIVFTMNGGEISDNEATNGGGVHVSGNEAYDGFGNLVQDIRVTFTMAGGKISGNKAESGGGIHNKDGSTVNLVGNAVISGNEAIYGGGIVNMGTHWNGNYWKSTLNMYGDAIISGNTATSYGGGIYNSDAEFNLAGGKISGNDAPYGGGVFNYYLSVFTMTGGVIYGNTAIRGGGVFNYDGIFNMKGGAVISGNAADNGGGIYTYSFYLSNAPVSISGDAVISYNTAVSGGGVWVAYANLTDVVVAEGVIFVGNQAQAAYDIDPNDANAVGIYAANIHGTVWSILGQGYNNYDISYTGGIEVVTYSVTVQDSYAAVSGAGRYPAGTSVTVNAGTRSGYTFSGWTITVDDITLENNPTATFTMPHTDVLIVANWTPQGNPGNPDTGDEDRYTVIYNGNGYTGGVVPVDGFNPYLTGSLVTVLSQGSLIREGYIFLGWATTPSATEAAYTAGQTFTITCDTTLYAVWTKALFTVEYQPGAHGTFDKQVTNGLSYGDPTPTAPKVTGEDGWKFTGWLPTVSATVTGNTIYIAQWEQETSLVPNDDKFVVTFIDWDGRILKTETVPYGGSATAPAAPLREGYTFIGWDRSYTYVTSDLTITAQYTLNTDDPLNVTPTQPPIPTPSAINDEAEQPLVWAFVNLALSIAGVVLAIIGVIYMLLKQHRLTDKQEKNVDTNNSTADDRDNTRQSNNKWLIAAAFALSIIGLTVFLLTENMNHQMTLIDKWTIINAVIFIAEIITILLYIQKQTKRHNQKYSTQNQP